MSKTIEWTPNKFDRVICRTVHYDTWGVYIFAEFSDNSRLPFATDIFTGNSNDYQLHELMLPFNEETIKLLGTTKEPTTRYVAKKPNSDTIVSSGGTNE